MKITKVVLPILAAVAIGGTPTTTFAGATQPAMSGHGWPDHFDKCFGSGFATMTNNCSDTVGNSRLLIVPTIVDPSGTYLTWVHAAGNGSNGMTNCQAIGVTANNIGVSFSQILSTNTSKASQTLVLGWVTVPGGGTLHYECHVAQGGGSVINVGRD